jgi:hypothetical protein
MRNIPGRASVPGNYHWLIAPSAYKREPPCGNDRDSWFAEAVANCSLLPEDLNSLFPGIALIVAFTFPMLDPYARSLCSTLHDPVFYSPGAVERQILVEYYNRCRPRETAIQGVKKLTVRVLRGFTVPKIYY